MAREPTLYVGDNVFVLHDHIADASVDLVYLDPPFNSDRQYASSPRKFHESNKQHGFSDVWRWTEKTATDFLQLTKHPTLSALFLQEMRTLLGESGLLAYLVMIVPRLQELHRVLKPTGSLYFHCDPSASHYIKIGLDVLFGRENFLNEIVWCYGLGGSSRRYWPWKHDVLLWYAKEAGKQTFIPDKVPATSQRLAGTMKKAPDYWLIPSLNNMARERTGYPTQKPEALLERIIRSSSNRDDVVLDPFCGSGTMLIVGERLGRNTIGIDTSPTAIRACQERCQSLKLVRHEKIRTV